MTYPVDARMMANDHIIHHRSNMRGLQITLLAVATLASLFSMMIMPWQLSLPLSAVLMGSALIFSMSLENGADGPIFVPPYPTPPLVIERHHFPPPPVIIDSRPHAPIERRDYIPRWQPTPTPVPMHMPSGPRAPVGCRTGSNAAYFGFDAYTPAPSPQSLSLSAPRAPVGHR